MKKTEFKIMKMDCPSEENLIRLKLEDIPSIQGLNFDIPNRKLTVFHDDQLELIDARINELNLDSSVHSTSNSDKVETSESVDQRRVLITVLIINFAFFIIEITTGFISKSMGLVADSLDMLADAFVYGISLYAVGSTITRKKQIATTAGYFQLLLAVVGFIEVIRRVVLDEQIPDFFTMIIVSVLALVANAICLVLLHRSKGKDEAHMKASLIFTSNDVIINLGVIIAAILVYLLNSSIPDLVIGSIVFVIVIRGAVRILKLGN
jgi:Co/Zn/Cd efflux system component